ncbi:unnamed protein product [Blepharisma stoltei]|uniref:Tyrosine-protein kinase ephrin type A/B receptor-like domain-containing protein n=1 Tax=Blepharisma stoltei TaxID=1481888 RepID=A0AAU9J6W0_9CILI|nr:unnamed protein product [Blepharisma stoltei]
MFYTFGGRSLKGAQNDLWGFNLNTMQWNEISVSGDIPAPRTLPAFTKYKQNGKLKFAIYGGIGLDGDEDSLVILDVANMEWTLMPASGNTPGRLTSASLQYFDGMLYLAGGVDDSIPINFRYNDEFYQYDLTKKYWKKIGNPSHTYTHRSLAGSIVYDENFYLFFGWSDKLGRDVSEISKVNLNDINYEWISVPVLDNSYSVTLLRDSYSFISVNSSLFIFAGYNMTSGNLNDLAQFSVSGFPITYDCLSELYTGPSARSHHVMQVIEGNIYIFGGDAKGSKLNDLWVFDPETEVWEILFPDGDVPTPRSHHSSGAQGNVMYIFGGIDQSGVLLNDLYQFDATSNVWKVIKSSNLNLPSARYSTCAVYSIPILYIFGGMTTAGVSNELWSYNCGLNTFSLISSDAPYRLYYPRCAVDTSATTFFVLNGDAERQESIGVLFSFNFSSKNWKILKQPETPKRNKSDGVAILIGDFVMYIGGHQWGTDPISSVYAIDLSNSFQYIDYPSTPMHFIGSAFAYYKTDLYVHGGVSSTKSFIRISIPVVNFYKISLKQFCTNESCPAPCSPGTYESMNGCKPCEKGTYNHEFGKPVCYDCNPGTYNPNIGSNTVRECFPCKEGKFNNLVGQSKCKKCSLNDYCPSGSSSPQELSDILSYTWQQPINYKEHSKEASDMNKKYVYTCIALFSIFTALTVLLRGFRNKLKVIDFYSKYHNIEHNSILKSTKNRLGGYFTVAFFIGASWFIYGNISTYVIDNIAETKALLPLAAVWYKASSLNGNITLIVTLIRYGGNCTNNGTCIENLKIDSNKIFNPYTSKSCYMDTNNNCIITYLCNNCEVWTEAEINISLQEPLSYCAGILVNLTSTSSIPNEISSEQIGVMTDSNKIFRGLDPTIFYFIMTPSIFQSVFSLWPDKLYGYYVGISANPVKGSQSYAYELPFSSDLNIKIVMDKNEFCLNTTRSAKQTMLILVSALLGAVFGWKGAMKGAMHYLEKCTLFFSKKIHQKIHLLKMASANKHLIHIFNSKIVSKEAHPYSIEESEENDGLRSIELLFESYSSQHQLFQ